MIKKITVVTALSTALLFGGALNSVDASASTGQGQGQSSSPNKTYYSVNGNWNLNSGNSMNDFLNNYFKNSHSNRGKSDWNNHSNNESNDQNKQTEEKQEQPKKEQQKEQDKKVNQEQPKQQAETPTQQPSKTEKQPSKSASQQLNEFEQQVVELTNQERENNGLNPLKIDTELSRVAREKSNDMQQNSYFAHNSPTYGSPFDMMQSNGISYRSAGENIARGQRTPEEVVNAWMNSEGHRANILKESFTHIGVGYVAEGNYWTQQFIGK